MKRKWIHVLTVALGVSAPALAAADPIQAPMVVTNLSGTLEIDQGLPLWCDAVSATTPVTGGRIELTPAGGQDVPGGKRFTLTRGNVSFAPFAISGECAGYSETRTYQEVGVQVARAVSFVAPPGAPGVYAVTIPKDEFLIYEAAIANGVLEQMYARPKQDVTGTINLQNRTVQLEVVVGASIHFKKGCLDACDLVGEDCEVCVMDEHKAGTRTATLSGTIVFPDSDGDGVPDPDDNCPLVANRDQAPVPPQIRVFSELTQDSCASARLGPPVAIDACWDLPIQVTDDAPDALRPGANVVTYTAVDSRGQRASARQTVTVEDATPPVFTSVPADLRLDNCGAARLGLPTAEDDCAGTPAFGSDAPRSFPLGRTDVTWTAWDAAGNRATARQVVEVQDRVAPAAACAAVDSSGALYRVSAADACTSSPALWLGSHALQNGATIRVTDSTKPGVRLLGVGKDGIAHYEAGIGEAVVSASDGSGNASSARCR